jgi:hypothetical protein
VILYCPKEGRPFGTGAFVPASQKVHPLGRVHCSLTAAKFLLVACCSQEVSGRFGHQCACVVLKGRSRSCPRLADSQFSVRLWNPARNILDHRLKLPAGCLVLNTSLIKIGFQAVFDVRVIASVQQVRRSRHQKYARHDLCTIDQKG